jgi:hypothetical protein
MQVLEDPSFEMRFCLNTALCQSPPNISKTMKAIEYIRHFAIISRVTAGSVENGIHHITVILTNNNLSETAQWKIRLQNRLKGLKAVILSSKKTSDMKSLDQLFAKMMRCKKADDLPDLLVMCTHEKRTSDLIDLIATLKTRRYNFTGIGIRAISLTIMFDEADKNMKLISSCLTDINPLITNGSGNIKYDNLIRDIHFITATPIKAFWMELKRQGISSLHNINTAIAQMDSDSSLNGDYKELMKDYRFLSDHSIHTNTNMTDDPLQYAASVLDGLDMSIPRTVFAPSRIYLNDHDLMRTELTRRGFHVWIDNSRTKGFFDLEGGFISLEAFNKANDVKGELYNTFVKWRSLHPTAHLAITGLLNITRGITFNTSGFNFTDVIISAYHAKDIASLVQLFGRSNGGKEFVEIMNLHCPVDVYAKVKEFVDIMVDILNKNPTEFKEKHFNNSAQNKKDKDAEVMDLVCTVPKVFSLSSEEYGSIKKLKTKNGKDAKGWDIGSILAEVSKKDLALAELIKGMECFQCTEPEAANTYKKTVTDFIARAAANKKYIAGKYEKGKDGYQIFLDKINRNVIVSVYYGSRAPVESDSDSDGD